MSKCEQLTVQYDIATPDHLLIAWMNPSGGTTAKAITSKPPCSNGCATYSLAAASSSLVA